MMILTKEQKRIIIISIIVYYLVIIWVVMFKMGFIPLEELQSHTRGPYLIPFEFIYQLYKDGILNRLPRQFLVVIFNFLMFIPIGLGLRAVTDHKTLKIILAIVLGSILEIIQVIFSFGVFDLWDIILNILGIIYGYALYKVIEPKMNILVLMKVLKVLIIIGIVVFIGGMTFAIIRLF